MKLFAKLLTTTFIIILMATQANASCKKADIDKLIKASELNKQAIVAVSVKTIKGDNIYENNGQKLLHPASVLKLLTLPADLDALGVDYKFKTLFYKDKTGDLYIKLGADPLLTTKQLTEAMDKIDLGDVKNIYIDDKITDRYEWGIGWMWDDDTNPRMPKFSSYNIDSNLIQLDIKPTTAEGNAVISTNDETPTTIINMVKTADTTNISAYRQTYISPNILYIFGTVSQPTKLTVPESNPELRFKNTLIQILKEKNILTPSISLNLFPKGITPSYTIENDLKNSIDEILKNSNNFYAESVFKIAGAKKSGSQGTFANSEKMFDEYYKKLGLNPSEIVIADGSGVSRNNLFSTNWISSALVAIKKDKNFAYIKKSMAQGGTGTLSNRLSDVGANVSAKTGTLANLSSISGYIKSKKGQEYVFSIIISNYNIEDNCAKKLEDEIIKAIYDLK